MGYTDSRTDLFGCEFGISGFAAAALEISQLCIFVSEPVLAARFYSDRG